MERERTMENPTSLEILVKEQGEAIEDLMMKVHMLEMEVNKSKAPAPVTQKMPRKKQDLEPGERLLMKLKLLINEKALYKKESVKMWEVAAELNISQKRLKEVIAITNYYNLKNLLNHYRINAACQMMLMHPAYSIDAIAEESGFNSIKSFYRWFRRETGMSPTDYKLAKLGGGKFSERK